MNENIDLTKILDGCPRGTKFYHAGFGRVWFVGINLYSDHPIMLSTANDCIADVSVTEKGTLNIHHKGECLLLPSKDQRDWSKFERFWDKPKIEKFDVNTLHPFDKILTRNSKRDDWNIEYYSHKRNNGYIQGLAGSWKYVIPYNKETKHLIGTYNDCPEYYKWWED